MIKKLGVLAVALVALAACSSDKDDMANNGGQNTKSINSGAMSSSSVSDSTVHSQELAPNVGDRVFFDYDSAVISDDAQKTLAKQADWLAANPSLGITVEGHCDERGTREYNLALGERRANAAKNYLLSLGVAKNRISTISYGKERPEELGDNEEAWAKNRRAVTVVKQ